MALILFGGNLGTRKSLTCRGGTITYSTGEQVHIVGLDEYSPGLYHSGTGAMFFNEIKRDTPLGREIIGYIKGGYMPHAGLVMNVLYENYHILKDIEHILADGWIREPGVIAPAIDFIKNDLRQKNIGMIDMVASPETCMRRTLNRDENRIDDQIATIKNRLHTHKKYSGIVNAELKLILGADNCIEICAEDYTPAQYGVQAAAKFVKEQMQR